MTTIFRFSLSRSTLLWAVAVLFPIFAHAGVGEDMNQIDRLCAGDGETAGCTGEAGTGLVNCLKAYSAAQLQSNPSFALSSNCQGVLGQFDGSGEIKEASQTNHACSSDAQAAGCGSEAVGSGLLKCLFVYAKQQPAGFQFSANCQAILGQVDPRVTTALTTAP